MIDQQRQKHKIQAGQYNFDISNSELSLCRYLFNPPLTALTSGFLHPWNVLYRSTIFIASRPFISLATGSTSRFDSSAALNETDSPFTDGI